MNGIDVTGPGEPPPDGQSHGQSDQRSSEERWDAERVRSLREHLGASQQELASRLGTRQQTVSEWETAGSRPRRMSRRLLQLVADEAGFYDARRDAPTDPRRAQSEPRAATERDTPEGRAQHHPPHEPPTEATSGTDEGVS